MGKQPAIDLLLPVSRSEYLRLHPRTRYLLFKYIYQRVGRLDATCRALSVSADEIFNTLPPLYQVKYFLTYAYLPAEN